MKLIVGLICYNRPEVLPVFDKDFEWRIFDWNYFLEEVHHDEKQLFWTEWIHMYRPMVLVSTGNAPDNFYWLTKNLSFELRKRWIHESDLSKITLGRLHHIYMSCVKGHSLQKDIPLLSVITTTYRSGHKILRPYHSLQAQTYQNWEWVIFDDSNEEDEKTYKMLQELKKTDSRIRLYKASRHSGFIGEMKQLAGGVSRGQWIIELDHDDDIVPELFQWIVNASKKYPDSGFIYSDCIELNEDGTPFQYGDFFSFGYGSYYNQWIRDRYHHVSVASPINPKTLRHIVGVPNHIRCWRRDLYHQLGQHNPDLPVADDYYLILESFLKTKFVHITKMGYLQYRNAGGNNFTFLRNQLIQSLVHDIQFYKNDEIHQRLLELGIPDPYYHGLGEHKRDWEITSYQFPQFEYKYNPDNDQETPLMTIVLPTSNEPTLLKKSIQSVLNQTYENWELIIIGENCPYLEYEMNQLQKEITEKQLSKIKWWNIPRNHDDDFVTARNYAVKMITFNDWISYMEQGQEWEKDHLETIMEKILENPEIQYVLKAGTNLCHRHSLVRKYGLWTSSQEEFISRWSEEKVANIE